MIVVYNKKIAESCTFNKVVTLSLMMIHYVSYGTMDPQVVGGIFECIWA